MLLEGRGTTRSLPKGRMPRLPQVSSGFCGHPDPRVNLAIVLETAGKVDDALAAYDAALEVYPDYLPAIMGAASLTLRTGREDERLEEWLEEIAMRGTDSFWREWALLQGENNRFRMLHPSNASVSCAPR